MYSSISWRVSSLSICATWILVSSRFGSINSNASLIVTIPIGLVSPTTIISSFLLKLSIMLLSLVPLSTDIALLIMSLTLTSLIAAKVPTPGDLLALSLGVAIILDTSKELITPVRTPFELITGSLEISYLRIFDRALLVYYSLQLL